MNEVKVGIGDLNLVESPGKIMTIGLGSCIGVVLYDNEKKIVGLSHIMLSDSTKFSEINNPLKFADLAIPILIKKMIDKGCTRENIIAKIAGGASMFKFSDSKLTSDIGKRNSDMVKNVLKDQNIPIISEEIGGNKGRTMIADATNGKVTIRIIGQQSFVI